MPDLPLYKKKKIIKDIYSIQNANIIQLSIILHIVKMKCLRVFWGFIDEDETMVIKPEYYSVGSFSNGYGPLQ